MSYAAAQYAKFSGNDMPPRDVEAMALARVNKMLRDEEYSGNRQKALSMNQRLWTLLLQHLGESGVSETLRDDLIRVGTWSSRYSLMAMNRKVPLAPLIDVNNDIIEGLRA